MDCVEAVPLSTAIAIKADHDDKLPPSPLPALPSAASVINPRTKSEVEDSSRSGLGPESEVSKSPPERFNFPLIGSALPSPAQSPKPDAATTVKVIVPKSVPASVSQESTDAGGGGELSVLQPPPAGSGKPVYIKRGPGRPRKDGAGAAKIPKQVLGQKYKNGLYAPGASRGIRGRKKADGTYMVGGTNGGISNVGELVLLNHESPPRITDDTAESDTSSVASSLEKLQEDFSLFPEQWPGKVCSFCNLGERSMMGQGELLRLQIPQSFDPYSVFKGLAVMCKSEKDSSSERSPKTNFSSRRQKGIGKIKRLTSQGSLESMNEPVDEVVGYVEEPELSSIFDTSHGHYYVHYSCALWCTGVNMNNDDSFTNLEKEIVRSMGQRCGHCGNLGAGLLCKAPKCMVFLHFPCAATSGAFQEPSAHKTICSAHIDLAIAMMGKAANCTVCDSPGNLSSLLMCNSCGHHYHSSCMALNPDPSIRAGWQCPACKMCQACRQPGDENKLLSCDTCDKSYHIFCLRPALSSIPKHSWKCKMCRICTDCGARTPGSGPSSRWHANFSVCDSCYQQRNKGLACPLCGKAYRHVAQKLMLQCHLCRKYVHGVCDPAADLTTYQQRKELYPDYEYICIPCKAAGTGLNTSGGNPRVLSSLKKEGNAETICNASQDSLLSHEDDSSLHGTENTIDLTLAEKASTTVPVIHDEARPAMPIARERQGSVGYQRKKLGVGRPKNVDRGLPPSAAHNRRHRITELVRKRGPKPKIRGVFGVPGVGLQRPSTDCSQKGDEEPGVENRLVLCSARDDFVLQQDVCVMCGAFGSDLEGRLISCAQCGQCYHPFCVNIKVTKVVLQKGWRCLDCTVCEGCGQRNDESRLILCDDCDISFHIYCIDPPLEYVPQGNWKCKWCAICHMCGSNDPGYKSSWHNNYTICGPCASVQTCHICNVNYHEGELVVQCQRCERWLHGACDMISDEVDAETCVSEGYNCVQCRPTDVLPPHLQPPPPPVVVKIEIPAKSPEPVKPKPPAQFVLDGICLSESGIRHIKSLTLEQPRKKRKKMYTSADMEAGILAAIESVVSGGDARLDSKSSGIEDGEKDKDSKKRQRNLQKLGIGGFLVRLRGPRFKEEEGDAAENHGVITEMDKPKRKAPRKKIKNKIVESFPIYLQEAFFGKGLLEPNKDGELYSDEEVEVSTGSNVHAASTVKLTKDELKAIEAIKAKQEQIEKSKPQNDYSTTPSYLLEDALLQSESKESTRKSPIKMEEDDGDEALKSILAGDLLDNDLSLVDTIMNEEDDMKVEDSLDDLASSTLGDGVLSMESGGGNHKDELSDFLTSQFNLESSLPSMDIKDVEDIFKGVLTDESQESQDNIFPLSNSAPSSQHNISIPTSATATTTTTAPTPSIISQNINPASSLTTTVQGSPGLPRGSQLQQSVQQGLASPISFPPPSPYHSEYSNSPQFSPAFSEPPSPWPAQADAETDQPSSYNQRSILKWEADEALGQNATISAVLYANMNHPELKRDFAGWGERSKQIAKIWRSLSAEKRAPYLQKARENRAASRMQKSQQLPKEKNGASSSGACVKLGSQIQSPECDANCKVSPASNASGTGGSAEAVPVAASVTVEPCGESSTSAGYFGSAGAAVPITSSLSSSSPLTNTLSRALSSHPSPFSSVSSSRLMGCSSLPHSIPLSNVHCKVSPVTATPGMPKDIEFSAPKPSDSTINKCDHQIRVLTASEIMRTLPTLSQESFSSAGGGFTSALDQDKMLTGAPVKPNRIETPEERQWKQMQAMRQQQAQQQQMAEQRLQGDSAKDSINGNSANLAASPKLQYSPSIVQRQLSSEMSHIGSNMEMTPRQTHMQPSIEITGRQPHMGTLEMTARQPLQVTTSNDSSMPAPQSSPHLQSPNSRQFASSLPPNRLRPPTLEMPPPSPSPYSNRASIAPPQSPVSPAGRAPLYSRIPYMHSPRQPMQQSPGDPYSSSPLTPQPDPYSHPPLTPRPATESDNFPTSEPFQPKIISEQYMQNSVTNANSNEMDGSTSPRTPAPPQGQETRQHLRDLLQRQQIKKMEEQMSPLGQDVIQQHQPQNPQRPQSWAQDDWQKGGQMEQISGQNFGQRHQLNSPNSPQMGQSNQFRQPFLPVHVRISLPSSSQQMQPLNRPNITDFRPSLQSPQPLGQQQSLDAARMRLMLQQQQRALVPNQQSTLSRPQQNFVIQQQQQQGMQQQNQFRTQTQNVVQRNPLDPYDHLVSQDRGDGNNVAVSGASMLSRQLAQPLNSVVGVGGNHSVPNSPSPQAPPPNNTPPAQPQSIMNPSRVSPVSTPQTMNHAVLSQNDHQELPDSVTAELEKLEQEQHNDGEVEAGELVDLGVDDDELLGMGADFNILEYADPELEQAVGGEKTNILDNLDLEEEKEDEKDDKELKRKEDIEKSSKKDNESVQQFSGIPSGPQQPPAVPKLESQGKPNPTIMSTSYMQHQPPNPVDVAGPLLRPPQPPPPYPGPPPPYPGRPQMGIRNGGGGGMGMPMPLMNLGLGMKHSQMGMENSVLRPPPHMPSSPLSSPSNNLMSLHQRRPLLLQEQPLLLEDLLEQEKREQQRQGPGPNLMGAAPEEPLLSDFDFERLKLDVLSSNNLPVSLSPPNVAGQGILPPPSQPNMFRTNMTAPISSPQVNSQWQVEPDQVNVGVMSNRQNIGQTTESNNIPMHPALAQTAGSNANIAKTNTARVPNFPMSSLPTPPTPPENPATEQERQMQIQYEQWLFHQQQVLAMQLKFYETEVSKLRKGKKSLNSKQRQLKKNGGELNENDAMELERISRDLTGLQKQLEQARKQSRQHSILTTDYRTKQQKRQQLMGMNTGGPPTPSSQVPLPTQASPLGAPSHSPLHSTPQSPMMSPSPMGGPASSPLMQHSPMASPLTPSPGPGPNSLSQTSPRSTMSNMHHMDDRPFSPNTDGSMRSMTSPQNGPTGNRMQNQQQGVRMGTPMSNSQQIVMSPGGSMAMNMNPNGGMMIPRGNINVVQMHQQRPMSFMDGQGGMQRIRSIGSPEQMNRMIGPMGARFQRVTMNPEMIMRARMPHQNFQSQNSSQMVNHNYGNPTRVPFPNQSPTGSNMNMGMVSSLRSPSPMASMGGMGSPPGSQVMLVQNRVSPASSPMRRPSGSGSVGVASPMPDRPQSVENPLTPRSSGSGPHTPSGISGPSLMNCHSVEGIAPTSIGDSPHYTSLETTTLTNLDNMGSQHTVQSYSLTNLSNYTAAPTPTTQTHSISDYGGGGGSNSNTIPYMDFSWFGGRNRMGLKGGSPFSVVNENTPSHSANSIQEPSQTTMSTGNAITETVNVVHQQPIVTPVIAHANNVATSNSIHVISNSASTSSGLSEAIKELNSGRPRDIEVTSKGTIQFVEPQSSTSDSQRNVNLEYSTPSISFGTNLVTLSTGATGSQHGGIPIKNCTGEITRVGDKINVISSSNNVITSNNNVIISHTQPSIQILGSNVDCSDRGYSTINTSHMPTVLTSTSTEELVSKSSNYVEIPPSSVHQANVNVLGGFRSTKSQDVISHLLDHQRLVPIQTLQSFDTSRLQNIQVGNQGNPVSLASFVADAVNAATLPFPQSSNRSVASGTIVSASVPLITVYSRPEMRNVSGNPTNLTAVLLTSPRLTTSVGGQTGSGLVRPTQPQIMGSPLVVTNAHSSSSFTVNKNSGPITSNIAISSKKPSIIAVLPTSSGSSQNQNTAVVYASMGKTSVQSGNICISTPIKVESNVPSGYATTCVGDLGNEYRMSSDHQYDEKDDNVNSQMKTYIKLEVADDSMKGGEQSQIHRTYMGTPTQIINTSSTGNPSTASIMQTILAQRMSQSGLQPKIQVSTNPSPYTSGSFSQVSTGPPHFTITTTVSPSGESQNALLKQLLQNTGCASMTQTATEPSGFSLTSCLRPAANAPIHTSHLSEAATKIPQPSSARPQGPVTSSAGITLSAPVRLPFKPDTKTIESIPVSISNQPIPSPRILTEEIKPVIHEEPPQPPPPPPPPVVIESVKDTISASLKETIDVVASDKTVLDPSIFDNKKADEEAKKAKRRQYQAKRRQSMGKEPTTPKKRARKGSKLEEDYDSYIENVMTQLRALPPVGIVEPELGKNFNVCSLFGAGDYSKLNTKGYNTRKGDLEGTFGSATLSTVSDYYNTKPFGTELPQAVQKPVPTHRGFYNQEFASPKMGTLGDKSEMRSPSPIRDTDTPDTIISTSSPECVLPDNNPYPGLRLIDDEESDQPKNIRDSPVIPMYAPIPIRPIAIDQSAKANDDTDKENINSSSDNVSSKARSGLGTTTPLKESGNNVTVTLTLSSSAAEDIGGILRNLANILSINAPTMYQVVERTITPPSQKFGLYTYKSKDGKEVIDIQSILNGAAKFCRHCDVVVLNNIIKKKASDLPGIHDDSLDGSDDYYFCGTNCFMQFSMTHGIAISSQEKAGSVVNHPSEGSLVQIKSENKSSVLKDCKLSISKALASPKDNVAQKGIIKLEKDKTGCAVSTTDLKDDPKAKPVTKEESTDKNDGEPPAKKWKGIKYKKWTANTPAKHHYKKPNEKEMTEMLFRMGITVTPSKMPEDTRRCMFCHQLGDCLSDGPGRLLNFDVDKWVHLNCALWSEEVYETENGALVNVEMALKQSLVLTCVACRNKGATVKCFKVRCSSVYHLGCALKEGCIFYKNKTVYCSVHIPKGEKENELTTLAVFRRVYIQRDENRQVAAVMHHADQHHLLRVGSLIFLSVGQLLPHQLQAFHTSNYIYPIGYKIVRFYWSMRRINKRCQYICSIHEVEGKPEFRVTAQEEGCKECVIKADSAQAAWLQVLDSISKLRTVSDTIKVFPKFITGEDLFGLTEPAIVKVLESLPGIETLMDYHFKYGRNPLLELPLAINPTGCARAEPKLRTHFKRPHTQRTASSARCSFSSSVMSANAEATCPYSKQFVHSKSSQYKKMKQEWRNNVFLARSKIQGLGLYAARDIEKHTMVIEYIGEIIRSELAELREKKYEASNRGIYMFRVDEDRVIDATLCGGLARYINHSCNPNCVAETVEVDRDLRIIIFANRRISRGEELAYDYKFEFEDDQHKIPCLCGAPNCRQWMN